MLFDVTSRIVTSMVGGKLNPAPTGSPISVRVKVDVPTAMFDE